MHEDAVQVIAGLLGGDGELRLVDQAFELGRRQLEFVAEIPRGHLGKIALGQRLQREARAAGEKRELARFAGRLERGLRALRQLAHDVVERVGGKRRRAGAGDLGRNLLGNLEIEIGGLQQQGFVARLEENVGQDRDRRAPLDNAVDMAERPQKSRSLDRDLHGPKIRLARESKARGSRGGATLTRRGAERKRRAGSLGNSAGKDLPRGEIQG